ncbi:MAG: hypothetical protein HQL69_06695 [Magnetococcales bacterium]|nr:hypothetical protein [Magnetococcales bacterium]
MKKLGNLTLPDSIQWIDRYKISPINQTVFHTLAGNPVVFSSKVTGISMTLAAEGDTTWLDQDSVDQLKDMAAQQGAIYPLIWEEFSCNVIFRHHEPPAISLTPLWPNHNQFTGTIRLTCI